VWLILVSCQGGEALDEGPVPMSLDLPPHFPEPDIPADNPLTVEKIALGRYLFYDVRLSINHKRSCGICHEQAIGFTDGFVQAIGTTAEKHTRNTLPLINVAFRRQLTWRDPSVTRLEDQLITPLMGDEPIEMGMNEALLLRRLESTDLYPQLFQDAFPDQPAPISLDNIGLSLASFQRTIFGGDAPYDRHLLGDEGAMSEAASRGMALFFSEPLGCGRCHGGVFLDQPTDAHGNVTDDHGYFNTGLYNVDGAGSYPEAEQGLYALTGELEDMGKFRTPSLRGVATSGPWTHDGTVLFLEDLIDAYARGGREILSGPTPGDGAENPYKSALLTGFDITDGERADLLTFLDEGLTDEGLLARESLSTPFCVEGDSGVVTNTPCEPPVLPGD
jgi:cytochrome c peroxidase